LNHVLVLSFGLFNCFKGFYNHGLQFKQLIASYATQYDKNSDYAISALLWHLKCSIETFHRNGKKHPCVLALTADNCAREVKNQWMLYAIAWLVQSGVFREAYVFFLVQVVFLLYVISQLYIFSGTHSL
jgi:hypothetical protein